MPETKEIAPEFDEQVPQHETLFIDRDCEYRRKRREDRMRKRGLSNEHDIAQSPTATGEEGYITAELKRTEKGQIAEPEKTEPQSFVSKLIRRKDQVMAFLIQFPRVNL